MHQLSPFTCRRLSQLPRLTSVWECDRRPLSGVGYVPESDSESVEADCIIWGDGLQGVVRGMSVVPCETGHEAIVRALLQAIEKPQGGVEPARPRKVIVRDREIQFFLRGALQSLDIPVEYAPELPFIEEVFEKITAPEMAETELPPAFETLLLEKAKLLWEDAPWRYLSEQEILAIELNCWDIETLYLSVLGIGELEYGLLFYRDLDSLRQFRHKLLHQEDFSDGMKQAFLEQNCLFINFNPVDDVISAPFGQRGNPTVADAQSGSARDGIRSEKMRPPATVAYEFGSLHPLEGLRTQIAEEEAASLIVVLEALHRFLKKHDLSVENFALQPVTSRFRIPHPGATAGTTRLATAKSATSTISVKISTLPDVSAAFLDATLSDATYAAEDALSIIVDDSVPEGSLIMLGSYKDKDIKPLRESRRIHYQALLAPTELSSSDTQIDLKALGSNASDSAVKGNEADCSASKQLGPRAKWPVLTIQTTRPKAKQLVERLRQEGGVEAICFNPGSDPISGQVFQVGLIKTKVGQLHLFNEYEIDDPVDSRAIEKWATNSSNNQGCCGCIIAAGATGARRGRPTVREVVGFFEAHASTPEDLELTPLVMSYAPDWS